MHGRIDSASPQSSVSGILPPTAGVCSNPDIYRLCFDENPLGCAIVGFDARIREANTVLCDMLGYERHELLGLEIGAITHPDEVDSTLERFHALVSGEMNRLELEKRYLRKDGSEFWGRVFVRAACDAKGRAIQFVAMIEDIDEQRRTEERARMLAELLEASPTATTVHDLDGKFLYANRKTYRLHGYTPEEFHCIGLAELDVPESAALYAQRIAELREHGESSFEVEHFHKDGSRIPLRIDATFSQWHGQPVILSVASDIGEIRRAQEALREKAALLQRAEEIAGIGSFVWYVRDDRLTWSDNMYAVFGLSKDDCVCSLQETSRQCIHPADQARVAAEVERIVAAKRVWPMEFRIVRPDGSERLIESSGEFLFDDRGEIVCCVGVHHDITERRRTEAALRESEQIMRYIVTHDPNAIAVYDRNLRYLAVSKRYLQDYNVQEESIIGRHHYEVFPEMPQRWKEVHQRCLNGATENSEDDFFERPDGSITYNRWECRPWHRADGSIGGIVTYTEVTTERKLAELALQSAHRLLKSLLDSVPDLLIVIDRDFRIRYTNGKGHDEISQPDLAKGNTCYGRFKRLDAPCDDCSALPVFETGCTVEREMVNPADGRIREVRAFPIFDSAGRVEAVVEYVRDITERKRFEKSLLASEEKYRTLFENAPLGIFRSTMEGRFIEVNPAIATLLRYDSPQEVIEHVRDIAAQIYVHPEERHQIIRALLNSNGVTRNTVHYRRRDGTVFIANLYLRLVRDEAGVPQLIEGMVEDITERKRAEEELLHAKAAAEAASRAKSYFLANMSHEIRTPMTAILGFTDVLLCDEHSPHKRREYLAIIRENGKVLLQLLNDVLDLSRIEARGIAIEPVPCNPRQVVEEVLALLRLRAEEKRLVLETNYQSPLPSTILTDAVRLRQVLVNLIGNGIKFTERGHVHVKVACSGRHSKSPFIHFTVSDTGIGIPPDVLSRLFQPFVQADDSFSRRYGGSGLGLAISKRLADALGGTLEVISCQGEGSTFTLSVPILAARQLEESLEPAEQLELGGRGGERATRVLLAEDVEAIRKFLCLVLRAGDVEVDEAVDGIAACKMAMSSLREQRPYDVILMDVQMPELDGLAATQRLRAQGWRWPIIALTAHAMEGDQERCLQAGCDSFLSKPVEREALLSAIAHWTEVARSASTGGN